MCIICEKTQQQIKEPYFVWCIAYGEQIHVAHCKRCKYHKYEHSIDWCRYRKGAKDGAEKEKGRMALSSQELGRAKTI